MANVKKRTNFRQPSRLVTNVRQTNLIIYRVNRSNTSIKNVFFDKVLKKVCRYYEFPYLSLKFLISDLNNLGIVKKFLNQF